MNNTLSFLAAASAATLFASVTTQPLKAAAITFNTALPVSNNELLFRSLFIASNRSGEVGGADIDIEQITALSVLGYGITRRLSIFTVLPTTYIDRKIGTNEQSNFGIGDAQIFARYEAFQSNSAGATTRVSPFFGIRAPTGERGQTGDGSTDFFGGMIFTKASIDYILDTQLSANINRENNGFDRGNTVNFDVSFQKRLLPEQIASDTTGFLFGALEANISYASEDTINGLQNINSGGLQVALTPGLQYVTQRWIADFAVKIPVINDLNGNAPSPDYSIFAGIRINF